MKTTAAILKGKSDSYTTVGEMKASYILKPDVKMSELPVVHSSKDAYKVISPMYSECLYHQEVFSIIFLSRSNAVLATATMFIGGLTGVVADPKVVMQHALLFNAASLIMVHNHPSGNLTPSEADNKLTRKMVDSGKMLDLPVVDHLIIGEDKYFSYADEGRI